MEPRDDHDSQCSLTRGSNGTVSLNHQLRVRIFHQNTESSTNEENPERGSREWVERCNRAARVEHNDKISVRIKCGGDIP